MEELLKIIFDAFPEKSTITFKGRCSDCGDAVIIDIVSTLGGFGLLGGLFVECSTNKYVAKCSDCCKVNSKMVEQYKINPNDSPIFSKEDFLNSMVSLH